MADESNSAGMALTELWKGLPTSLRVTLGVVIPAVIALFSGVLQLLGFPSAAAMFAAVEWWHVSAGLAILLLAAGVIILRLIRRGPAPTEPPGQPREETGEAGAGVRKHRPVRDIVGRRSELARLRALAAESRIVTVWGTAGVGKTRLCAELLNDLQGFPAGALWVDLEEVTEATDVAGRVAKELGFQLPERKDTPGAGAPEAPVAGMLAARGETLVILDAVERAQKAAAPAIEYWAEHAPNCTFVVTSVACLELGGERALELEPLDVAEGPDGRPSEAAELFCQRARAVRDSFAWSQLPARERELVHAICRAVGGLPWAIEAAAANVADFGLDTIHEKLQEPDVLRDYNRLVDRVLLLLPPAVRTWALRLSVFPGSFQIDAVAKVVTESAERDAREAIRALRAKRLLQRVESISGSERYVMYSIVRFRCAELWQDEAAPSVRQEHFRRLADYYGQHVALWDGRIDTDKIAEALDRLEADLENALQVFRRCLDEGDHVRAARIFVGLTGMLRNRRDPEDRVSRLTACLDGVRTGAEAELTARVLVELGVALYDNEKYEEAFEPVRSALELAGRHGLAGRAAGDAYLWHAILLSMRASTVPSPPGQADVAREALEALDLARDAYRKAGDPRPLARVQRERAAALGLSGAPWSEVTDALDEADRLLAGLDAPRTRLLVIFQRLGVLRDLGDYAAALDLVPEAQQLIDAFQGSYFTPYLRFHRASLLTALGGRSDTGQASADNAFDEAADIFMELAVEARRTGRRQRLLDYLIGEGDALIQGDDLRPRRNAERAMKVFAESNRLAAEFGHPYVQGVLYANQAYLQLMRGNPDEAETLAARALELLGTDPFMELNRVITLSTLARAKARLHREDWPAAARRALEQHERLSPEVREQNAELRRHMGELRRLTAADRDRSA